MSSLAWYQPVFTFWSLVSRFGSEIVVTIYISTSKQKIIVLVDQKMNGGSFSFDISKYEQDTYRGYFFP